MTARKKATKPKPKPLPKEKAPKVFSTRMLPKIRMYLHHGMDEFGVADCLGVEIETFLLWKDQHFALQDMLDCREDIRKWDHERNLILARELAARGASNVEIAETFRISPRTLSRWRLKYPDFDEALNAGEEALLKAVERSLYEMALGYSYEESRIITTKAGVQRVREIKVVQKSESAAIRILAAKRRDVWGPKAQGGGADPIGEFAEELQSKLDESPAGAVVPVEKDKG